MRRESAEKKTAKQAPLSVHCHNLLACQRSDLHEGLLYYCCRFLLISQSHDLIRMQLIWAGPIVTGISLARRRVGGAF